MNSKKEKIITIVALVALLLVTVGISYAAFHYIGQGQRENTIQTGNLTFVYDESNKSGNGISIDNATPTPDDEGKSSLKTGEVFEFSVTASTKGAPIYYEIYTAKQDDSTLPERVVKTYLTELDGTIETEVVNQLTGESINLYSKLGISQVPNQTGGRTLYQEMIPEGQEGYAKTFRYRMWIREDATDTNERGVWKYSNKTFTVRVNVYASNEAIPEAIKPEQEPNEPILVQGQIPVVYDKEKSSWVKADTGTNWYNYSNQEWANAVTVKETGTKTREEYMSAEAGTEVSMDDINTMWVWIPRYEYMYTNLGTNYAGGTAEQPGEIKINFLSGASLIPSDSANYKVHPAFTFGTDELEGIWYAKFEIGGTLSSACTNENCNVSNVVLKPNVSTIRNQQVSSLFYMIRSMQTNASSPFGFSITDSNIHMIKNDEWSAAAYLSQSKYGKYGNPNYEIAEKQVRINNCANYITGIGASSQNQEASSATCTTNTYETANGMTASTTGNITGVYDMSGGTSEFVMGVLADPNGLPRSGRNTSSDWNSGFTGMLENGSMHTGLPFPESKYYNLYTSSNISSYDGALSATACNSGVCYGHALSETGGWYNDGYTFIYSMTPWLARGYYHRYGAQSGTMANVGVFFVSSGDGGTAYGPATTRSVLVPIGA